MTGKFTYRFRIAGIVFEIRSDIPYEYDESLLRFLVPEDEQTDDSAVRVVLDTDLSGTDVYSTREYLGKDMMHRYYAFGQKRICEILEGKKLMSLCICDEDYSRLHLFVNEDGFPFHPHTLGWILRLIPLNDILQNRGRLFLHASEVEYRGRSILFAAPSGTGKTTQAKLWKQYRNAGWIRNDRTILMREGDHWRTYGFPIDGSEPVKSNVSCLAGAVVLLSQGKADEIREISAARAAALLMGQCVIEEWDPRANEAAMHQVLGLIETVPVYDYACTPQEHAVEILEKRLLADGVFEDRKDGENI